MTRLTGEAYLAHLRADVARMVELAPGALDAEVPRCAGWTVAHVLRHTGEVYARRIATVTSGRTLADSPPAVVASEDDTQLVTWFAAIGAQLHAVLAAHDDDEPTPTWWTSEQTVGFWKRRMAHESAVHRVDVERAVGAFSGVSPDLARDGIDEVLTVFLLNGSAAGLLGEAPAKVAVGVRVDGLARRVRFRELPGGARRP